MGPTKGIAASTKVRALARAHRHTRLVWYTLGLLAGLFVTFWLLVTPIVIAIDEKWTYAAAFYYSTQAGLGIGYGALAANNDLAKLIMVLQITLGSLVVAGVVAYILGAVLDKADAAAAKRATASAVVINLEGDGTGLPEWRSFAVGLGLLFAVLLAGILYGVLHERWSFVTSLLFITSTCQTSGLVAPTVSTHSGAWPSVFVAVLDIAGVPVWAYFIGKVAHMIAAHLSSQRRLFGALEREKSAEAAFARRCEQIRGTAGKEGGLRPTVYLDKGSFLELWLLRNDLICEETLASIEKEFATLQSLEVSGRSNGPPGTVPLWKVRARLRFVQLLGLQLTDPDAWEKSFHAAAGKGKAAEAEPPVEEMESDEIDEAALEQSASHDRLLPRGQLHREATV